MRDQVFFICPCCDFFWYDRNHFLRDKNVKLTGYQVHFDALKLGMFLFNHSCETTFSLKTEFFFDMYDGPVYREHLIDSNSCPGYCLRENCLDSCPQKCECAFVRKIIQLILDYPKRNCSEKVMH